MQFNSVTAPGIESLPKNCYPVHRENCLVSPGYLYMLVPGHGLAIVRIVSVNIIPQMQVSFEPKIMPTKSLA